MKTLQLAAITSLALLTLTACSGTGQQDNATLAPASGTSSIERAGSGQFDATSIVSCALSAGQPMTQCDLGVAREGNGTATVVINKPDGAIRTIFFNNGVATGADTSQADGDAEFSATKDSDLNLVRVGGERYEIPDSVIFGG